MIIFLKGFFNYCRFKKIPLIQNVFLQNAFLQNDLFKNTFVTKSLSLQNLSFKMSSVLKM